MLIQKDDDYGLMAEMNMTPFVDVMLVLLVIFIVTAPFITPQSLKVNLPRVNAVSQSKNPKVVSLMIDASGKIAFDGKFVNDIELSKQIQIKFKDKDLFLEVQCDKAVSYGRLAQIMSLAQKNGALKLSFVTLGDKTKK
jgi:biopolymer transport protein ExbD